MRHAMMTHWMQDVDNLFFKNPTLRTGCGFSPAVDVRETEKEYLFQFDLPGLSEKELSVQFKGRELTVAGERKTEISESETRQHRSERFFGRFERSFLLPEDVNAERIDARFKDGVLEIRIPKKEEAQPKAIPIRSH